MVSRRLFLQQILAAPTAIIVWGIAFGRGWAASSPSGAGATRDVDERNAGAAPASDFSRPSQPGAGLAAPPWELLHPLAVGSVVAHGWRVTELTGVAHGACVLTLQDERNRLQRLHLCRNDGRPLGLVHTAHFDLLVMNGGDGDLPTEEGLAQAVAQVAQVLAANEGKWRHARDVEALLPHAERLRRFADASDTRLR